MNASTLTQLDKTFDSRIRLSIMTILMVEDTIDYISLKTSLELTDGNLASHIKALEKEAYIEVKKSFLGRKPNTNYQLTVKGREAFANHLTTLENMINIVNHQHKSPI